MARVLQACACLALVLQCVKKSSKLASLVLEATAVIKCFRIFSGETDVFSPPSAEDSGDADGVLSACRSLLGTDEDRLRTGAAQVLQLPASQQRRRTVRR